MALRRDILFGVIFLAALHAVLSFGAIGLFTRMAPEIELILKDNVVSLEACENMLAALALPYGPMKKEAFEEAMAAAQDNVTEAAEIPFLATIEERYSDALLGIDEARRETVAAVLALGQVNRDAMRRSDERAKRLGNAGSWAAVFLAMTSFMASVVVIRHMRRRVITPLGKIHDVIVSVRQGNLHRRCATTEMSGEIAMLAAEVNGLIERLARQLTAPKRATSKDSLNRAMLLHAIDKLPSPAVFVNSRGDMLATNKRAIDLLSQSQVAKNIASIQECGPDGPTPDDVVERVERVGDLNLWLCLLRTNSSAQTSSQ